VPFDDAHALGCCFAAEIDYRRKTPAHVYSCRDIRSAAKASTNAGKYCFQLEVVQKSFLFMASSNEALTGWVHALRQHAAAAKSKQLARTVHVDLHERLGLTVNNWEGHPIGVVLESVDQQSPLCKTDVAIDDVLLAVNGEATLSHTHAMGLLRAASGQPADLIIFS
jgi:hypothetical protein